MRRSDVGWIILDFVVVIVIGPALIWAATAAHAAGLPPPTCWPVQDGRDMPWIGHAGDDHATAGRNFNRSCAGPKDQGPGCGGQKQICLQFDVNGRLVEDKNGDPIRTFPILPREDAAITVPVVKQTEN